MKFSADRLQLQNYFKIGFILSVSLFVNGVFASKNVKTVKSQSYDPVTVSSRVAANSDDAEERISDGAVDTGSSDLELGGEQNGSVLQVVGMRFNNVDIEVGAVITNAYIEFEVDEVDDEVTYLIIYGQADDNPVTFVESGYNLSSRAKTNATVAWDNVPLWTTINEKKVSPDLTSIVQEIVSQPGWVAGNSIVIMVEGTGERTAESHNGESANAPLLVVTYLPSGAPTPTPSLTPTPTPTPTPYPEGTIRLAVIGDFGTGGSHEAEVASVVNSWNPDYVFTTGDNNYPDGAADTIDDHIGQFYSQYIGNYQGVYGPGSENNRFWPSLGNHDWHTLTCDLSDCSGAHFDYFTLPNNERYYDVDLGLVHLFAVDSDTREPDGSGVSSIQANWLQTQLTGSDSCYNLVFFHHPPYSSGRHGSIARMQWPFADWGADSVMSGHDHLYERLEAYGIPFFINGAGGGTLYDFENLGNLPPEATSIVRYNEEHGAMLVTANPDEVRYQFYNSNWELIDDYTVLGNCNGGPTTTPTPTLTPTQTLTPTPTSTPTPSLTPTPTSVPDTTPPTVSIIKPLEGEVVQRNSDYVITADAVDDVAVAKVDFLVDGETICSLSNLAYECLWRVKGKPLADYAITVTATDPSGNSSSSSVSVTSSKK